MAKRSLYRPVETDPIVGAIERLQVMNGDDPPCPGCEHPMEFSKLDGNYAIYTCRKECEFRMERPVVTDLGEGTSVEDLQSLSQFGD